MIRGAKTWIIAYDIPHDDRRSRLSEAILSYGYRIQYSVFVVIGNAVKLRQLQRDIEAIMYPHRDSVLIIDLGEASVARSRIMTRGTANADVFERPTAWTT